MIMESIYDDACLKNWGACLHGHYLHIVFSVRFSYLDNLCTIDITHILKYNFLQLGPIK